MMHMYILRQKGKVDQDKWIGKINATNKLIQKIDKKVDQRFKELNSKYDDMNQNFKSIDAKLDMLLNSTAK